jgi:hypothetical protein
MYGNRLRLLNAQRLPEIITLTSSLASSLSLSLSQSIPLPKKKDMPDLMKKKKPTRTVLDTKTLKKQGRQQRQQQLQRVVHDTWFLQFPTVCDSLEH